MPLITFKLEGPRKVIQSLRTKTGRVPLAVSRKMNFLMTKLQEKMRGRLSGDVLAIRTGTLYSSVQPIKAYISNKQIVTGVIAAQGKAKYGMVHEYGGTTSYEVIPINKKALTIIYNDALTQIVAKVSNHPPAEKRPFFKPSVNEMREEISVGFEEILRSVMGEE